MVRATVKAGGAVRAGADNACEAKNSCKGKDYVDVGSIEECTNAGGKVVASK
jgi:uncharacterized Zn finger protein